MGTEARLALSLLPPFGPIAAVIRRTAAWLALSVVSIGAMVGVEVVLAMRRDYLPTAPAMQLGGAFGPEDATPLKLVVLGDSTAAGVGAPSPRDAYPSVLAERLAGVDRRVTLAAFGISGARVADVLGEQVPRAEAENPDVVFVGIGANDTTHLTPLGDVRRNMREVVRRLRSSGARVVVAGAPDMRASAFYEPLRSLVGWRGCAVAGAIADAARSEGAYVVPLAEKTGPVFATDPDLYNSEDDFHPSAAGYRLWADAIYPVLERATEGLGAPSRRP